MYNSRKIALDEKCIVIYWTWTRIPFYLKLNLLLLTLTPITNYELTKASLEIATAIRTLRSHYLVWNNALDK